MAERKPISAKVRFHVLARDGYACQCCGARAPNATLHVDHIVPVARGGGNDVENLRAICVTCNLGKSDDQPVAGAVVPFTGTIRVADNEVRTQGEPLSEPIYWIGYQWAVTAYGVEQRNGCYVIEAKRLWEDEPDWGWLRHMAEKNWVDMADFRAALMFAREKFAHLQPKKKMGRL